MARKKEKPGALSLELTEKQKKELTEAVLGHIFDFYNNLNNLQAGEPCWNEVEDKAKELIEFTPPEEGTDYNLLLDKLFNEYIPPAMNFPSPGFMGFIPSSAMYQAALSDFIAKTTNRHVGHSYTTPFLTQLESNVIRWFANIIGFPENSKGIMTSGGSIANLTAIIAARSKILGNDISKGVIYMSDQTHHSIHKGALCAGIMNDQQRIIPTGKDLKIDTKQLLKAIENDKKEGKIPFMIVGNAGTTNAGTVDPLEGLAEISKKTGSWFHIDAAYGGFFVITDEGKSVLRGIEKADSVTMNPLKSLFLPLGFASLVVRSGRSLEEAFSFASNYFPDKEEDDNFWNPAHMSLELSRSFRGLSVWLPIKMHGLAVFRDALKEKMTLAQEFAAIIQADPNWDLLYPPELSLLGISCKIEGSNNAETNEMNKKIIDEVNKANRSYLTGAQIKDRFVIRVCVLSHRTHKEQLNNLYEDLNNALDKVV